MLNISLQDKVYCKKQISEKGFAVIKDCISLDFLKHVESEVLKFSWTNIGKAEVNLIHTQERSILSSVHNLVSDLKIFNYLYKNSDFLDFYTFVLDTNVNKKEKINSSYFFKAKESQEIKLHQDNAYFNLLSGIDCLTFYIPLHKQNKKSGTIFYYAGSHELGSLRHIPKGNLGASMCLEKNLEQRRLRDYNIEYIDLLPGDMVIHNALVVHGTLPNPKSILCEAFNFTLFGESNKRDSLKYKRYRDLLKNYLDNMN